MGKIITFSPPDISQLEIDYVVEALRSGWITTGPKTKQFEREIAVYCSTPKAVCLNSATAAMELTLRILGVGPGDEVITSAYTYTASASVAIHCGATIVLVDTAPDSFEMDYFALEKAITPRTKAIIPVDVGGNMCDYDTILAIVERKKNLFVPSDNPFQKSFGRVIVMADAAHSFGATYKSRTNGTIADFTCFSFHAVKNLTTAEGGAVVWKDVKGIDNEYIYHEYMLLSLHGQSKDALSKTKLGSWEYDIVYPAYKCNMTDILSSLGLAQLHRYQGILARRKEIIDLYNFYLKDLPVTLPIHFNEEKTGSGHLYLLQLNGKTEKERNIVIEKMGELGIACNVHYKPLPMFTAYKALGFVIGDFPNAFNQYQNEISLPLYTLLSNDDIVYICSALSKALNVDAIEWAKH
ncbi:TPA: capsular biosynthesis protein [Candidatus Uhrbacteria bacterium]|nr:capsular biosynthesis protein [Candidatus Uhrbacteria bacterium]